MPKREIGFIMHDLHNVLNLKDLENLGSYNKCGYADYILWTKVS